jgi:hypothetical protein
MADKPNFQLLSAEELLMLVEALDHFLPARPLPGHPLSDPERWAPYQTLRERLATTLGMGFFDTGSAWLDRQLSLEREATLDHMLQVLYPALKDPAIKRPKLKALIQKTFVAMKWEWQYTPHPVSEWDKQVSEWDKQKPQQKANDHDAALSPGE